MNCFVTGTDTEVGKTYFTTGLLRAWVALGYLAAGFKPISTGSREDTTNLLAAGNSGLNLETLNPIHLQTPLCPWIAARRENRLFSLDELVGQILCHRPAGAHLAIEGVGGWLTPLTDKETVADLASKIGFPVVIVTRVSLGTLNHTLLTIDHIRRTGLPILGLILNYHGSTNDLASQTNPRALAERTGLPCLPMHPHQPLAKPLPAWLDGV